MNKKHIVVFGLDNFGMSTIKQLSKYNCEILAIDKNIDKVEDANEYATYAMQLNMQDADDFEELSLNSYDIAIITFSDIQTSILAALVCKENNIELTGSVFLRTAEEIKKETKKIYKVPFGLMYNNHILENLGPNIPYIINILGQINNEAYINVKEYGINNSIIEVILDVEIEYQIMLAFEKENHKYGKKIIIESKIIQGKIPNYYNYTNSLLKENQMI